MSRFGNANLSEPLDSPGVRFATLHSPALKRRADMTLYVPEVPATVKLSLLILLHGVHGSHWNWWAFGKLPSTADALIQSGAMRPFAIAMPSDGLWGDGSGYVAHRDCDAESWIIDDVPGFVGEMFPPVETERFYLAGLSMGGFGAMRLGMKYAARVQGISAHSAVTRLENLSEFVRDPMSEYRAAGEQDVEILHWAREHRALLPPLRFDCGYEDSLLPGNRALHAAFTREGIAHVYEEFEGGHTWDYWRLHVQSTLRFVSQLEEQGAGITMSV